VRAHTCRRTHAHIRESARAFFYLPSLLHNNKLFETKVKFFFKNNEKFIFYTLFFQEIHVFTIKIENDEPVD